MGNATFNQTNFTAGQISRLVYGRTDFSKFYNGVATLENFISLKHGPVTRRPGSKYVAETKSSQAGTVTASRLIPFQFSTDQTYVLEFGDGYVRFYLNRGRLQDDGTVTLVGADADSPFELETPYRLPATVSDMSGGTFTAGGDVATTAFVYNESEGEMTATVATHSIAVGEITRVLDTDGVDSYEGVFPVLRVVDANTLTYARNPAADATATNTTVQRSDRVTLTFSTAHGISPGQYITVSGVLPIKYNGSYLVETTPLTTTLTYRRENGFDDSDMGSTTANGSVVSFDTSVSKLDYAQSADVMFMAHENVMPKELQRKNGFTISAAAWEADIAGTGRATLTIADAEMPHGFQPNDPINGIFSKVIVTGMTPSGYNGCYTIDTVTDTSISYTVADPGASTVFGSVDGWQIVNYENKDGPYLTQNNIVENDFTTTVAQFPQSLVSDNATFNNLDVGRVFRINHSASISWGWGRIAWYASNISVNYTQADVDTGRHPADSINDPSGAWYLGAWSNFLGWPRTVGFIQGRLSWGGNKNNENTLWTSMSNALNNFDPDQFDDETVNDDNGITVTIDDDQVNAIFWQVLSPQGMLIGCDNGEFLLQNRSKFDPLTPSNKVISVQSFQGSKRYVKPIKTGNTAVMFVQKAGRKIYQMLYDFNADSLKPTDITKLSENITVSGIDGLAFQQEPNPIIWAYLGNGSLIGCTYEIEEEVVAWHKHIIGGTDSLVKSIAVISDTSGDAPTEQLWMIVSRTINTEKVEYVEYLEDQFDDGDLIEDAFYVDGGVTWTGSSTTTIPIGLHLEGETVKVLADGLVVSDKTVDGSGNIELATAATKVQAGLSYTSKLETIPVEMRQAQPESTKKIKRLERAHVNFIDSQGVQFGITESSLEDVVFSDTTTLHTDLAEDLLPQGSYERDTRLWIVNSGVLPTTIGSIVIEAEVQPIQS